MRDPIRGQTVRWQFTDGPTRGTSFEHEFKLDGTVTYRMHGSDKSTTEKHYETEQISDGVWLVSYLASSGWTLTCLLDTASGQLVAVASNEKQLVVQHGRFEIVAQDLLLSAV